MKAEVKWLNDVITNNITQLDNRTQELAIQNVDRQVEIGLLQSHDFDTDNRIDNIDTDITKIDSDVTNVQDVQKDHDSDIASNEETIQNYISNRINIDAPIGTISGFVLKVGENSETQELPNCK